MARDDHLAPAPEPAQLSMRPIVIGGSVLFALAALVIALIPDARDYRDGLWLWACVAGVVLGILGLGVMRLQKAP
ncbi:DUF2530 domain-containing protein [Epidermidibacterium keratini]|uniref:DUF2530 domain-containing protein n=1 Tax=Epidermidibacterium keratini TaxID=1891644 RepID=A0A7L4YPZ2_9ACTN|nr:DUF2530 domain-containing protein [Epidermidibacterium keratini]QHC01138.1 DUF2530 domain-containing protein [Epidermidibacterium keratini]